MPVFVVLEARRTIHASMPRRGGQSRPTTTVEGQDFWQRIGTAIARPDGGYTIALAAIPIAGRLIIRPAKTGERRDPTCAGAKE